MSDTTILHTAGSEELPADMTKWRSVSYASALQRRRIRPPRLRLGAGGTIRVLGRPGIDAAALKSKAEADPNAYVEQLRDLTERKLAMIRGDTTEYDREADEFSFAGVRDLKAMQTALDFDIEVKIPGEGGERIVQTSAFPLLSNALIVLGVNEAYEAVPTVGEMLVTDIDDNKKISHFAGVLSLSKDTVEVKEGDEFVMISAGEEKFLIDHLRQGLQIAITQELFEENDFPGIEARLTAVGEIASELIEEQTLKRVTDHDGSALAGAEPFVLHHPANSGTSLFQTDNDPLDRLPTAGNRLTNNALVNTSDVENLRIRLAGMKNSRGKRIMIPKTEMVHLVPDALLVAAWKIYNSTGEPGIFNELNFFGPEGMVRPMIVSTPKLDDLSTSAHYFGAPRRQFRRKWKNRPEIVTYSGRATESYVRTREGLRVRIMWDMEVGAVDYVYWLQSLAGLTAPKDE